MARPQLTRLGRKVPRRMVPSDPALPYRAHEEDRPLLASAPRPHPQLLPRPQTHLQRRGGGSEQQGQSHHEKILRLSHLPSPRTGPLSLTWQATRAGVNPRFLLTNPLESVTYGHGAVDHMWINHGFTKLFCGRLPIEHKHV